MEREREREMERERKKERDSIHFGANFTILKLA